MSAKSKSQQQVAGASLAAKGAGKYPSELRCGGKSIDDSMNKKKFEKMAWSKRKGKPEHGTNS